jgi:hypothetical protein
MKASDIQVGMVIDQPDSRGYLIRVDDHHDRVTHTIPLTDEVGVFS